MKILAVFLTIFTVLTARAGALDDFLATRPELVDVRAVQRALAEPSVVLTTNQVARDSATVVDERRVRQTVVPELMTRAEWDGLRDEARERRVKRLLEQRILGATNDAQRLSALYLERRVVAQVERIVRDGGEPWSGNSEQTTVAVVTASPGPSWWQTHGNGAPVPGKDEIRAALLRRKGE